MSKIKSRQLVLGCVVIMIIAMAGSGLRTTLWADKNDEQSSRFPEKPRSSPEQLSNAEDDWIRSLSESAKRDLNYRSEQIVNTTDQLSELRFLMLGKVNSDLALIVKLVEKAKTGRISSASLASYLRWRQKRLGNSYNLDIRRKQLTLELCVFEIGQTSWREFVQYMNKMRASGLGFNYGDDAFSFNQIIDLMESQIITPREGIDTLIMFGAAENQ